MMVVVVPSFCCIRSLLAQAKTLLSLSICFTCMQSSMASEAQLSSWHSSAQSISPFIAFNYVCV